MDAQAILVWIVPFFLIFMGLELFYFYKIDRRVYKTKDTLCSLSCGFGQALVDSILKVFLIWSYDILQRKIGIAPQPPSVLRLISAFIVVDFMYYVYHRLSHNINWMWAIHVVHHSSSEFNYSVALRQAWFQKLSAFPFYLLFIFTGVGAELIGVIIAIHACWQFLSHTRMSKNEIPIVRWLFVTPAHHRVHHGTNPQYINRNFAGVLSVWDRLFNSYEPEVEAVKYGISPQLEKYGVWKINTHIWLDIFRDLRSLPTIRQKWKLLWSSPQGAQSDSPIPPKKSNNPSTPLLIFQTCVFLLIICFLAFHPTWPLTWRLTLGACLLVFLIFSGQLIDKTL
ncbi:MAG: sterol desaturase family protein [Pseudomonadota bacterium]|nr:sterol desaturase family protein [Pseudomonadota bacterium]